MGKVSLYKLALKNKGNIDKEFNNHLASLDNKTKERVLEVIDAVYDYTVSVRSGYEQKNEKISLFSKPTLLNILKERKYKNGWELHPKSKEGRDAVFGSLTEFRHTFDGSVLKGTRIKYLALNNGKLGPTYWGDFTLSFLPNQFKDENVTILKYNSLIKNIDLKSHFYFLKSGTVNFDKLQHDLCSVEDTRKLVLIKQEIKNLRSIVTLEKLLIRPINDKHSDYIEVLVSEDVNIVDSELRVNEDWMKRLIEELETSYTEPSSISNEIDYFATILDQISVCEEDGILKMTTIVCTH